MRKESKLKAKELMRGNLLHLTGYNLVMGLPIIAISVIQLILITGAFISLFSGDYSDSSMNMIVATSTIIPLVLIAYACGFSQLYGLIGMYEDEEVPKIAEGFAAGYKNFFKRILVVFIANFLIQVGLDLFVIPGIVIAIGFQFIRFIAMEEDVKDRSVFGLIGDAWDMTKGYRMELFKLGLSLVPRVLGAIFIIVLMLLFPITLIGLPLVLTSLSGHITLSYYNMYKIIKDKKCDGLEDCE